MFGKKLIFCSVFLFVGLGISCAQNVLSGGQTINVKPTLRPEIVNDLQHINMQFCDPSTQSTQRELSLFLRPGQKQYICTVAYASASGLAIIPTITSAHVDLANHSISCDSAVNSTLLTGLVSADWLGLPLQVSSGEQFLRYFSVNTRVLSGSHQTLYACLGRKLAGYDTLAPGEMFLVEYRKAIPIIMTVTGDVYHRQWFDDGVFFVQQNSSLLFSLLVAVLACRLVYEIIKMMRKK